MAKIGPGSGSGAGGARAEIIPPNDYVLALRWFQRKRSKSNGNQYLSCKFEVAGGKFKGKAFFCVLGLDLSKEGNVRRWQIWMEALGITETFELGDLDDGTAREGDQNIRRLFMNRPFAAEVEVTRDGQYENNAIKFFHFRRKWTPQWIQWCDEFIEAEAARSGRPEDALPPDDEFGPEDYDQSRPVTYDQRQPGDDTDELDMPARHAPTDDDWLDKF